MWLLDGAHRFLRQGFRVRLRVMDNVRFKFAAFTGVLLGLGLDRFCLSGLIKVEGVMVGIKMLLSGMILNSVIWCLR